VRLVGQLGHERRDAGRVRALADAIAVELRDPARLAGHGVAGSRFATSIGTAR